MDSKTKKILIIAAVGVGIWLLISRRTSTAQTQQTGVPAYLDNINYSGREKTDTGNFYVDLIGAATNAGEKLTRDIRSFIEQSQVNRRANIQQSYDELNYLRMNDSMYNSGF